MDISNAKPRVSALLRLLQGQGMLDHQCIFECLQRTSGKALSPELQERFDRYLEGTNQNPSSHLKIAFIRTLIDEDALGEGLHPLMAFTMVILPAFRPDGIEPVASDCDRQTVMYEASEVESLRAAASQDEAPTTPSDLKIPQRPLSNPPPKPKRPSHDVKFRELELPEEQPPIALRNPERKRKPVVRNGLQAPPPPLPSSPL